MSVRQTLAITDDQLCELMETFSSVSVACRVMSSDCVRRRDRSLGVPPFTDSKPVIGGSHIFCCHSSDVTRKLQKCFDVVFTKNHVFPFTLLIYLDIVTGMKIGWDMAVLFRLDWQWKRHFKKLLSQQAASVYSQCKDINTKTVLYTWVFTKHDEKWWLHLKFHLLIYSLELVKIQGRLNIMNKLIM